MNGISPPASRPRMFKVISPIEKKDGTKFWMRVGTGYPNKDQSINLYLDAMPFNHTLQIREMVDEDFAPRGRTRDGGATPAVSAGAGAGAGADDLPF